MKKVANVIGATGLVGTQLVKQLLNDDDFECVKIFVRRDTKIKHPKLEQHIINFNDSSSWSNLLTGDVLFSALGTTLKQAGSKTKQYAIDYTLNYNFAQLAKNNYIESYVLVSSLTANPNAKLFYPRMKGKLDYDVEKLNFEQLAILRPGPLLGERAIKRFGEVLSFPILRLLTRFMLKKYSPIRDEVVAKAMVNAYKLTHKKKHIWEGQEIFRLAETKLQPKQD